MSGCKSTDLTEPRPFNLMFKTVLAQLMMAIICLFRPETAQQIFTNFKNVVDSSSKTLPFGIAQIGKAFRNEITPRNFIFRVREFEQMELEFFVYQELMMSGINHGYKKDLIGGYNKEYPWKV